MDLRRATEVALSLASVEEAAVRAFLPAEAAREYAQGYVASRHLKECAETLVRLAAQYNSQSRTAVSLSALDPAAYALYYLPVNAWKVAAVSEAIAHLIPQRQLRVVDFGSGPGTALYGLAAALPNAQLSYCAIEQNREMQSVAHRLWQEVRAHFPSAEFRAGAAQDLRAGADLTLMCNVLSECASDEQQNLLAQAVQGIGAAGVLIIIEPALKHTTRRLMELRDFILSTDPSLHVHLPCVHRMNCPMLARDPENWCHAPLSWQPPKLVRQLDELTGFNKHRIKLSALVLSRKPRTDPDGCTAATLITEVERNKIGFQGLVCSGPYYGTVTLSRKNRSPRNAAFEKGGAWEQVHFANPVAPQVGSHQEIRAQPQLGSQAAPPEISDQGHKSAPSVKVS